jgi:arylformamidase
MPIFDISLSISNNMTVWPGDTPVRLLRNNDIQQGDLYTSSQITTTVHVGSHLDAPMHFLKNGYGVDQIDLNKLIGPCLVIDLPNINKIDAQSLENANIPGKTKRLLCRTRNSKNRLYQDNAFHTDYVAIDPSGADWIVQRGIQLIGLDYFSVSTYDSSIPTHEKLLKNDVIPVEGLDLCNIVPGEYQLICLPLKIMDCEGSPVRAILIRD